MAMELRMKMTHSLMTNTTLDDGDGYGDNPNGSNPDAFPNDLTEWRDGDGDGYGDNSDAFPVE